MIFIKDGPNIPEELLHALKNDEFSVVLRSRYFKTSWTCHCLKSWLKQLCEQTQ